MEEKRIPQHVSIIMDGNGRWAKARGRERLFGHREGAESVRAVIRAAAEAGVRYLSLYAFSEENWGRPSDEVNGLMEMLVSFIHSEIDEFVENGICCRALGNRARLSAKVNAAIDEAERRTAGGQRLTLLIFLSYSGRWDIVEAAKKAALELGADRIGELTIDSFSRYLVTDGYPDPDLLIRTSGEQRISNYLLWQSAYTEFYYTDILWPDFRKEAFNAALEAYAKRDRRYGKVK